MNKEAIALAADSAVTTFSEQKIFTSANKLFSLSKYHPVGIMIYGNATFMGIPWETLVKMFRKEIGITEFDTLNEYAQKFIEFLTSDNILIPENEQKNYIQYSIYSYFDFVNKLIKNKIETDFVKQRKEITENDVKVVIKEVIQSQYDAWIKVENIPSIPTDFNQKIIDQNEDVIRKGISEIFGKLPLTTKQKKQLKTICGDIFAKFPQKTKKQNISGIVIAGFGKKEIFPSYVAYEIDLMLDHCLKYKIFDESKIDFNTQAALQPFAQSEMVFTFMEGVNPSYMNIQHQYIEQILRDYSNWVYDNLSKDCSPTEKKQVKNKLNDVNSIILKDYQKNLTDIRKKNFTAPITQVITVLPKGELAEMAESLVNLTSFKRKMSMDSETVGGPIDVAIISKGDGFIWIKKKHYFKSNLNIKFFQNYYDQGRDGDEN